ncbi:pyridine nucleotide-disulfide oxidoreductase [Sporosarcina sp. P37]|uniref:dihydrolipoyl dehydrogenase family protein n=1 Tax=unclassified Sporosarcina TaxID=2647733 RepID=UPI000A17D329|nr:MULTISPECIES: NAD(P)/FAD-dependent oxidoreductase [unclassified Sporosarcina]ARK23835.1 pyridine nucleotide-disulfide oxidoreductase [Sporosarcina sp. P37]PID17238.1 NAD(P)/FAD-dependent oxidoreductase [Sporosarcina sp. P35]
MLKEYDLIVIGTGNAGSITAVKCRKAGWSVAMIDDRPFGGTCSQRGCDPKKILGGAAELIDWNKRMRGKGIDGDSKINWPELMTFKRTFTKSVPEDTEEKFKKLGMDVYHGKAVFQSETELKVCSDVLKGKHILIASGAKPVKLNIPGEEYLTASDEFMELDHLPKRIVFIGGGFISFEFAHIAARAGSEVHILHRSEKPLKHFDQDLVKLLIKRSEEIGIHVHLNTPVNGVEKCGSSLIVKGEQDDREVEWKADLVVHGAGRVPALDMDLEAASIQRDKQGISVNKFMQSISNPHVYAAGDAASTDAPPLTPVATTESHVVAANLLKGNHKTADYPVVPSVVFTVPKLASVGMSEQEAKESGLKVYVKSQDATEWFTYKHTNEGAAAFKVIIDQEKDVILGAHLLSGEADELINHFALAIRLQIPTIELKKMPFAYPTSASDIPYML